MTSDERLDLLEAWTDKILLERRVKLEVLVEISRSLQEIHCKLEALGRSLGEEP